MPDAPGDGAATGPSQLILFAFATVYLVWGSTYFGIKVAGETLPPFMLAGARFMLAGVAMMAWSRWRGGGEWPRGREWIGAGGVGLFLVVISNAPIVWVERRVDSGLVALFAAASPLLMAGFNRRRLGIPVGRRRIFGMVLGTIGLVVLASATINQVPEPLPLVVILIAITSWSFGSTYGRDWTQPRHVVMSSGTQMLVGGTIAFVLGLAAGELRDFDPNQVSTRSIVAWWYLVLFGSMLAYTCYQWLLAHVEVTKVATTNYVNPIVAVALGVSLGGELFDTRIAVATLFLIPAVVIVVSAPSGSGPGGAAAIKTTRRT